MVRVQRWYLGFLEVLGVVCNFPLFFYSSLLFCVLMHLSLVFYWFRCGLHPYFTHLVLFLAQYFKMWYLDVKSLRTTVLKCFYCCCFIEQILLRGLKESFQICSYAFVSIIHFIQLLYLRVLIHVTSSHSMHYLIMSVHFAVFHFLCCLFVCSSQFQYLYVFVYSQSVFIVSASRIKL